MDKNKFKDKILSEIKNGEKLRNDFSSLKEIPRIVGDGMACFSIPSLKQYNQGEKARLKKQLSMWERRTYDILKCYFGEDQSSPIKEFQISDMRSWLDFKDFGIESIDSNITTLQSYIERIDLMPSLSENDRIQENRQSDSTQKPYKIFISHASEDAIFVNKLVNLIEFIGIKDPQYLLCSSLDGYRISLGVDFADYILKQFYDYKLFVIIIHSHNYYKSPYCLNEMGAAWVLKTEYYSFLTKDFTFDEMKGVINNRDIAIKVDSNDSKSRLNALKDKLITTFNLEKVNNDRWERLRDDFLTDMNKLY